MEDIHELFVKFGSNAKVWINKCKMLLPEIDRQKIWYKKGFGSIYEYAAKLAGLSHGQVQDALRIMKKIEDKPALLRVAEKKGLGSVRPAATIATIETQEFWANKAEKMPVRTFETYVRESRHVTTFDQKAIQMTLSQETADKLEKIKGDRNWEELIKEFISLREGKKPEKIENAKRYISKKIERYAVNKTNGKCAYPGCCKDYQVLHHSERFAKTKEHDPDKIIPLCNEHHKLVHFGLVENESQPPEKWKIRSKSVKNYFDRMFVKFQASAP